MFECFPWALTRVMSGLQKLRTDLWIVSSDRSFQIVCSVVSGPLRSAVSVSAPGTSPKWLPPHVVVEAVQVFSSPCQWSLGSACRAICFAQLRNSFLRVAFSSIHQVNTARSTSPVNKVSQETATELWWKCAGCYALNRWRIISF